MPAESSCPVAEVDRVLAPYIHSRQETQKNRKVLSRYLSAHVRPPRTAAPRHLDQECPDPQDLVKPDLSGISHSRLQYLKALQAKSEARLRLQRLQSSLEDLRTSHISEATAGDDSGYDSEVTQSYITLLRQRRRFAELEVIQVSLEKLLNAKPTNSHKEPKSLVEEAVGEQPSLPPGRLEQLSQGPSNDTSMLKLKKEVLEAKANMDRAQAAKSDARRRSQSSPVLAQQVYALTHARDELVTWVEGELAKMSEESEMFEDASPVKRWPHEPLSYDIASPEIRIRSAYNSYTEVRLSLINAYGSIHRPLGTHDTHNQIDIENDILPPAGLGSATIAKILPHLPHIAMTSKNERSLLQQAVYLQSRLSSADDEIADSLLRLAEESHLLSSGQKHLKAWGKTAAQSDRATEEFVSARMEEIHQEVVKLWTIRELSSLHSRVLVCT
ncbi:hypothetical protein K491DRAFT_672859 [Lophiostoma macrostomum CBS 122681]|uniref:Uncharacterized protein n=1 Tax=Lophiostoma macrostomum CBS 122681 TaxID=1314788 RepID=A0A6A6TV52_9PLEO|nr:hypothetical protein K491DRAFT_672859 [Lophiostoma macrostomum CBS 122681]